MVLPWRLAGLLVLIFGVAELAVLSTKGIDYCHSPFASNWTYCFAHKNEPWDMRAAEDPVAVFTFLLAVIAIGQFVLFWWQLSLISNGTVHAQMAAQAAKDSAEIARNSLEASIRPWLDFTADICSDLTWNEGKTPFIDLKIEISNVGTSPALHTNVVPLLLPGPVSAFSEADFDEIRRNFMYPDKTYQPTGLGISIFPNKLHTDTSTIHCPHSLLSENINLLKTILPGPDRVVLSLAILVSYYSISDSRTKYTLKHYSVGQRVNGRPSVNLIVGTNVQMSNMVLEQNQLGMRAT